MTLTKDEALKLALEFLEQGDFVYPTSLATAIKEALAQPEQEPVAWIYEFYADMGHRGLSFEKERSAHNTPLYTTPPQEQQSCDKRKPLTDEELRAIENKINPNMRWRSSDEEGITFYPSEYYELIQAIEAAHGIKEKHMNKDSALKLAIEALEAMTYTFMDTEGNQGAMEQAAHEVADKAITAIKEVQAQPEQEPKCNPHPKAPHGFNRNASHTNDRYTCDCESWDAYDAGYQAGVLAGIEASMRQEPEQEPVAVWELFEDGWDSIADQDWMETLPVGTKLYTTPPQRTWVGLTQDDIDIAFDDTQEGGGFNEFARAIEAKLKEKNT